MKRFMVVLTGVIMAAALAALVALIGDTVFKMDKNCSVFWAFHSIPPKKSRDGKPVTASTFRANFTAPISSTLYAQAARLTGSGLMAANGKGLVVR